MARDHTDYNSSILKPVWQNAPASLTRNSSFPLDKSSLFLSLEDAEKYASGNSTGPGPSGADQRGLYKKSFAGQIIGVKIGTTGAPGEETGIYDAYIIQGDGTLKKMGESAGGATGSTGATGPKGDTGATGAEGPQGSPGTKTKINTDPGAWQMYEWLISHDDGETWEGTGIIAMGATGPEGPEEGPPQG